MTVRQLYQNPVALLFDKPNDAAGGKRRQSRSVFTCECCETCGDDHATRGVPVRELLSTHTCNLQTMHPADIAVGHLYAPKRSFEFEKAQWGARQSLRCSGNRKPRLLFDCRYGYIHKCPCSVPYFRIVLRKHCHANANRHFLCVQSIIEFVERVSAISFSLDQPSVGRLIGLDFPYGYTCICCILVSDVSENLVKFLVN